MDEWSIGAGDNPLSLFLISNVLHSFHNAAAEKCLPLVLGTLYDYFEAGGSEILLFSSLSVTTFQTLHQLKTTGLQCDWARALMGTVCGNQARLYALIDPPGVDFSRYCGMNKPDIDLPGLLRMLAIGDGIVPGIFVAVAYAHHPRGFRRINFALSCIIHEVSRRVSLRPLGAFI